MSTEPSAVPSLHLPLYKCNVVRITCCMTEKNLEPLRSCILRGDGTEIWSFNGSEWFRE